MSDFDEDGRRIPDREELQDAWEDKQNRLFGYRRPCLCGWPDWPGQCPGPENCPVHGEDLP